jgi:molecular chaperone GrpE
MERDDTPEGTATRTDEGALPVDPPAAGEAATDAAAELEKARAEARESRDRFLRVAADFENFKKRNERERQDYLKFANERLVRELLPLTDNLSRALEAARKSDEAPGITSGLDLVVQDLGRVFKRFGVEPIDAVGRPFDPSVHEALQQIETEEVPPGVVVNEVQRGYTLHGRVLRPALVTVATAPEVTAPGGRPPLEN